jgi:hypothetical protein
MRLGTVGRVMFDRRRRIGFRRRPRVRHRRVGRRNRVQDCIAGIVRS